MGLEITWYRGLTKAKKGFFRLFLNDDFPGRANEIEDGRAYHSKEAGSFNAGSFTSYNEWREELAKLAGWPLRSYELRGRNQASHAASAWSATEGPFWELIHFSDCEGVIGAAVSAKLARDFAEYQGKADQHPDQEFRNNYAAFRNAFEKAADNGAVKFH